MTRKFKVHPISDISDEDVANAIASEEGFDDLEEVDYDYDRFESKREEIEDSVPKEMIITLEDVDDDVDQDELEEMISDAISDESGWLHGSFDYEEITDSDEAR